MTATAAAVLHQPGAVAVPERAVTALGRWVSPTWATLRRLRVAVRRRTVAVSARGPPRRASAVTEPGPVQANLVQSARLRRRTATVEWAVALRVGRRPRAAHVPGARCSTWRHLPAGTWLAPPDG